ncbi:helix-turn-helix domain-containing protein [Epilithonimonas caeni]|uniref:helix-turn-helix domain-containing protein n=1 Tax=Epilithonimonas caeni TaxID=365343 RepID=UPI000419F238|nr:helix-turn-helix transcriptional regulator [Epilithonimonas caeni]
MDFNYRITKVIEYSKLSPAEFAEEINVQRSSISHIISGRNKPSLDFITKIKVAFPDIEWDWLINGQGEMLISEKTAEPIIEEKPEIVEKKKSSLPDLFSLINDDNFGMTENEDKPEKSKPRESDISKPMSGKNILADSQPLENFDKKQENSSKKIRRIVFFYQDGTFETYEN